jgi:hypothetical protein
MTALAVQKAIDLALAGMSVPSEATAAAPVTVGIVDHPAENAAWPIVVFESHEIEPSDAYDADESTHTVEIITYSRYRGSRQVLAIMAAMVGRLHGQVLSLEAGQCLSCRVTRQRTTREPDGTTYSGTLTLTIITANEEI